VSSFYLDPGIVKWVLDFLTFRPQSVSINGVLTQKRLSSTGSPSGVCPVPTIGSPYTNDCRSHHNNRFLLKFADDTVLVSLLQDGEVDHGLVLNGFVDWCDHHFLKLNVLKTKNMVIDFRKTIHSTSSTVIKGSLLTCCHYGVLFVEF